MQTSLGKIQARTNYVADDVPGADDVNEVTGSTASHDGNGLVGRYRGMEEVVSEAIRRVPCAARGIAVGRPAASPVISSVRLVDAGGVAG
jgi:hypothetical protein